MSFNSIIFILFFLPMTLFFYYIAKKEYKNFVLLIASVLFYSWTSTKAFSIILIALTINYLLGKLLGKTTKKKAVLFISLSLNILLLFFYKYSNFFLDSYNKFFNSGDSITLFNLIIPLGISYIVFQQISYIVDIYFEKINTEKSYLNYCLYILFFPKIIAGPITRYSEINSSFSEKSYSDESFNEGIYRFSLGLGKKVIIASTLQGFVDNAFSIAPFDLGTKLCWLAMIAYSLQIYFDFSGYTDMAIGIAKMFLFNLPENFNSPYKSRSITEFWKRWHITLTSFLRDYIYIPLGGSRKGYLRTLINIFIIFLISGFWHGANFTFILWGAYHGFFMIIEKLGLKKLLDKLPNIFSIALCFFITSIGWVFFRAENLSYAFSFIKNLFVYSARTTPIEISRKFIFYFIVAMLICFIPKFKRLEKHKKLLIFLRKVFSLLLFIYSLSIIAAGSFKPFIYFNF